MTPAAAVELADCRINAGPGFPGIKARCGTLERPADPADPAAGTITLNVAVVPALSLVPEPDPFVPIAGGPGQGSVQFYSGYAAAFELVRRDRDVLLVDQRGTGDSSPLACEFDDAIMAETEYTREETLRVTSECLEQLPHDPRYFTTSVAVTDLEAVREALGYGPLNLYGISYGSRVAQHFARQYPDSTRTIILDGVVPPQVPLGPEIATEAQSALDRILLRCAEDEACNERFPKLAERFEALKDSLDAEPVQVVLRSPLTGRRQDIRFGRQEMAAALRLLAYHPSTIALIPLMIDEASNGNYEPLAGHFQMTGEALSEALSIGMHNAVMCTEDVPFYDGMVIDADGIAASYIGSVQLDAIDTMCSLWPRGLIDEGFKTPLSTDKPVLLLSGSADPITPPRYAELAMVELEKALHLVNDDQGHGQAAVGCTPRIIGDFVATADLDALETDCLERSFVMPFFLDFGGPAP